MILFLYIFFIFVMYKIKVILYEYMCFKIDIFMLCYDNVINI